jgi:hypothetical protein
MNTERTYVADLRDALMDDLNDPLELRSIKATDGVAECLLLVKRKRIILRKLALALLAWLGDGRRARRLLGSLRLG